MHINFYVITTAFRLCLTQDNQKALGVSIPLRSTADTVGSDFAPSGLRPSWLYLTIMKKTIAEILTDTLKGKHICIYALYSESPDDSGIVKKVTIESSWDGESIIFLLDKGLKNFKEVQYFFEDIRLEIC